MALWQGIIAVLVGLTVIVTFIYSGIGGWKKAGYKAAIEALQTTSTTQANTIITLRENVADRKAETAEIHAEMAKNEADHAKREAKLQAEIAALQTEVKNLKAQRPSIDMLTSMSERLDEYFDVIVGLVKDSKK